MIIRAASWLVLPVVCLIIENTLAISKQMYNGEKLQQGTASDYRSVAGECSHEFEGTTVETRAQQVFWDPSVFQQHGGKTETSCINWEECVCFNNQETFCRSYFDFCRGMEKCTCRKCDSNQKLERVYTKSELLSMEMLAGGFGAASQRLSPMTMVAKGGCADFHDGVKFNADRVVTDEHRTQTTDPMLSKKDDDGYEPSVCEKSWRKCICHNDLYAERRVYLCGLYRNLCQQECHCEQCRRVLPKEEQEGQFGENIDLNTMV